jgi:hypothetical protein
MPGRAVALFKQYPFKIDQKISIADGPRSGDWLVIGISKHKVKLRCPVSDREFEWNRFCYFVEEQADRQWPQQG